MVFRLIQPLCLMEPTLKLLVILFMSFTLTGCFYQTENGIVFGKPSYEQRDAKVTEIDLEILERTDKLLTEENWTKDSLRECTQSNQLNLYCALETASIEVNGAYNHRQPALQEVRFAIDDHYRSYWSKHRLSEFNGNPLTNFSDVKKVITVALNRVKSKLKQYKLSQQSSDSR